VWKLSSILENAVAQSVDRSGHIRICIFDGTRGIARESVRRELADRPSLSLSSRVSRNCTLVLRNVYEIMGSPADLALGCRAESPVATTGNLFKVVPSSREKVDRYRAQMLDEYLKALEDERRKIEAFKRELPHCMQLLDYG
jgi:hypothetical protein